MIYFCVFRDYEDGISSVPVIAWTDFLPKIPSQNGNYEKCRCGVDI